MESDDHARILDAVTEGVMVLDGDGLVLVVNAPLCRMFGIDAARAVGRPPWLGVVSATDDAGREIPLADLIVRHAPQSEGMSRQASHLVLRDGRRMSVVVASRRLSAPADDPGRRAPAVVLTASDVTSDVARDREVQVETAQLRHRALHDSLTGLPNRTQFLDQLSDAGQRALRDGTATGVIAIDLDDFKPVNDNLGHAVGDEVLVQASVRLLSAAREEDMAARLGGDEFVLLCEQLDPARADLALSRVVSRIDMAMREPYITSVGPLDVGASIGWAMAPPGAELDLRVLTRADALMLESKRRRKSGGPTGQDRRRDHVGVAPGPGTGPGVTSSDDVGSMTVFIVDDDPAMRLLATRIIQTSGTALTVVGEASSGATAIPAILDLRPDLVLCDVMMPTVSGPEVVEEVRRSRPTQLFVFWSASGSGELQRQRRALGVPFVEKDRIEQLPALLIDLAEGVEDTGPQGSP